VSNSKSSKEAVTGGPDGSSGPSRRSSKPLYSGPTPPPNRFHIRPGYRWDAIDRGNGFENILLKKLSDRSSFKEDEYRWAVSDM
jgi:pre-mRNA-splicing factor CWC26